jgi:hypothetical protein
MVSPDSGWMGYIFSIHALQPECVETLLRSTDAHACKMRLIMDANIFFGCCLHGDLILLYAWMFGLLISFWGQIRV